MLLIVGCVAAWRTMATYCLLNLLYLLSASLSAADVASTAQDLQALCGKNQLDVAELESILEFVYQRTTATLWRFLQDDVNLVGVLNVCHTTDVGV